MKITVPWERLASSVFDEAEGDIITAYNSEPAKRKVFSHGGRFFTTTGILFSHQTRAWGIELFPDPAGEFRRQGRRYRTGTEKITFLPADRAVAEWRAHLRRTYEMGGFFTSEKTYHQVLTEAAERQLWDYESGAYRSPDGNYAAALRLELAGEDYSKWHRSPEPQATTSTEPQLLLL